MFLTWCLTNKLLKRGRLLNNSSRPFWVQNKRFKNIQDIGNNRILSLKAFVKVKESLTIQRKEKFYRLQLCEHDLKV